MVPMLWHSAETPNPSTMAWSAQTKDNGWPLNKDGSCRVPYFWRIFFHGARNRGLSCPVFLTYLLPRGSEQSLFKGHCNTRFIKGHKPSNHICARIKSHVYTIE